MSTVEEIIDGMFDELEPFFTALISSFLFNDKPGGGKYTMNDFKSPVFLSVGVDILAGKKSNVRDVNLLKCREIMKKMCENYCEKYAAFGDTYKRNFRMALASYWVYLIKTSN